MSEPQTAKVVIIEDDETIREGYTYLISNTSPYQVVATYPSFDLARNKLATDCPQVILLDIQLPGTSGLEALPQILKILPKVNVIMLTVYETEKMILDALAAGASGYFTKNTSSSRIINAIGEVLDGGGPMGPDVAKTLIKSLQKNQNSPLTKRETQILKLLDIGKDRGEIANDLFIDVETVKTHVKNIYLKLDVNSRSEAIILARKNKLI